MPRRPHQGHALGHLVGGHVVEHDHGGPGRDRLVHLVGAVALDLDHPARATGPLARATASVIDTPARWLSLTSTASERLPRWLCPPPARTAAFSRARRPGVVLRVSRTRVDGLAARDRVHVRGGSAGPPPRGGRGSSGRCARRSGWSGGTRDLGDHVARARPRRRRPGARSPPGPGRSGRTSRPRRPDRPPPLAPGSTMATVAVADGGTRAAVRSPRGRTSSARARATASTTAGRGGSTAAPVPGASCGRLRHRTAARSGPGRCRPAAGGTSRRPTPSAVWTIRRRQRSEGSGKSLRAWAPRVSLRTVADDSTLVAAVTRLASSPWARSPGTRPPTWSAMARTARAGRVERRGAAHHAGPGDHGPLELVARLDHVGPGPSPVGAGRRRRRSAARPAAGAATGSAGDPASSAASPRWATARPPRRAIASARRAPNTIPSSSELDARRLAPWTPVQATSPAAHRPGQGGGPRQVGEHAPREVVGGGGDGQPVAATGRARWRPARRRWWGTGRRRRPGRWRPATGARPPAPACARPWPG